MFSYDPIPWMKAGFEFWREFYLSPLCHLINDQRGQRSLINIHTGQIEEINAA
jgi:hypothetical protein